MSPVRILFTSAGNEAIDGFAASLREYHPDWTLIGVDAGGTLSRSMLRCDHAHPVPWRDDPKFTPAIVRIANHYGATILWPLSTADLDFFTEEVQARIHAEVPTLQHVMRSSDAAISIANDKVALHRFVAAHASIDVEDQLHPLQGVVEDVDGALSRFAVIESMRVPGIVIRPAKGTASRGAWFFGAPGEDTAPCVGRAWVPLRAAQACLEHDGGPWPRVVAPYLPGPEFSVDLLLHQGRVTHSVVRRRWASIGGVASRSTVVDDWDVRAAAVGLAESIPGIAGVINVQYRRAEAHGRPYLLEINPRIPGTIGLTVKAGLDLPTMYLENVLGLRDPAIKVPNARVGVSVVREYLPSYFGVER